ncbi:hypothetical protein GSF22_03415 [Micromonospora echinofusca]|uniref:Uncharacterized protein n=1 Tax=Micromonospora echinofusca TaxID=47858 RepID=A0ABS3VKR9_MICEH|nr:hypothetical protein [Micromonospora echinofusca]MBO4205061.1 hypothetical protein [Micromonospora echinofusca]
MPDPGTPGQGSGAGSAPVSRATLAAYAVAAVGLVGWFLFGWLVLQQGFVSSVGEAVGTAFALLLAVSIVGTVRRSRRD